MQAGINIVLKALEAPVRQIAENSGVEGSIVVGKIIENKSETFGFDAQTEEYVDMVDKGIIDPAKVVRAALQDAASVAGLLVTAEAMVAEMPKKEARGAGDAGRRRHGRNGLLSFASVTAYENFETGRASGPFCFYARCFATRGVIDKAEMRRYHRRAWEVSMKRSVVAVVAACLCSRSRARPPLRNRRARRARDRPARRSATSICRRAIFSELGAEAILKENRQGTTLVSAELDVCHLTSPTSNRLDRFVVPLKVEGNRLTGAGQSQEGKQAVSVNLTRRVAGGNFSFEGTITSGSITEKIRSTDNTEMTEEEITDQFLAEPAIEPAPADFTAAWPQALHVRVGRAALTGLLDALRDQNVRVVYSGLAAVMPGPALGHTTPCRSTSMPSASARSLPS